MMKELAPITARTDAYLSANKYCVDEGNPHIALTGAELSALPAEEFGKLVRVCPAGLYAEHTDGTRTFDYAGCLECGTCRIACEDTILSKWENPRPGMGVTYRFG